MTVTNNINIKNPKDFGRVLVIYGGDSNEREISLKSGDAVISALISKNIDAFGWDPKIDPINKIMEKKFDRAWIALHGQGGEDGSIQGLLEFIGIPYTGSDILSSAVAMNKLLSKRIFIDNGISVPKYKVITTKNDLNQARNDLGFPLILKPVSEGSSLGMTRVSSSIELGKAFDYAKSFNDTVLAEECILGEEITVSILQNKSLPSIRIKTPRIFYDFKAKYKSEDTNYICPGADNIKLEKEYSELALRAFEALGCSGWGRVDFMHQENDCPKILEVNTVPGMTEKSLVPMSALESGLDFPDLCWKILETSIEA
jgi:D-alanine-D-alanine ligase